MSFCDSVRTCRRWDCINVRQRERAKEARFAACASLLTSPSHPQNAAKVRVFSRTASAFTAETDCLLEEGGFELSVPVWSDGFDPERFCGGVGARSARQRSSPDRPIAGSFIAGTAAVIRATNRGWLAERPFTAN